MFRQFPLEDDFYKLKTVDNKTPFAVAVEYGHYESTKHYFKPPDGDHKVTGGDAVVIETAVRYLDVRFIHFLASSKSEQMLNYIIHVACREPRGHELLTDSRLQSIFKRPEILKPITKDDLTPLMVAVKHRQVECVRHLLDDPFFDPIVFKSVSLDFQRTVLHLCAEFPNDKITDLLRAKGISNRVNLSPIDALGNTPLHICAQKKNTHMCKELLRVTESSLKNSTKTSFDSRYQAFGSNTMPTMLKIRNNNGVTAFHEAIENGNSKIVEVIMEMSSDRHVLIEDTNEQLRTSLHIAAWKGKPRVGVHC